MVKELLSLCLVVWAVASGSASAQQIPAWMKVRGELFEEASAPLLTEPASLETLASRSRQDRARRIVAAGAGFMLSAAVTTAYVLRLRRTCLTDSEPAGRRPLVAAATVGAIGFVGAVGGATWLAIESRRYGYQSSRRQRVRAAGIGALTFVLVQVPLGFMFLADQICNS